MSGERLVNELMQAVVLQDVNNHTNTTIISGSPIFNTTKATSNGYSLGSFVTIIVLLCVVGCLIYIVYKEWPEARKQPVGKWIEKSLKNTSKKVKNSYQTVSETIQSRVASRESQGTSGSATPTTASVQSQTGSGGPQIEMDGRVPSTREPVIPIQQQN